MRAFLAHPLVYRVFTAVVGGARGRRKFATDHIRPRPGDRVLDIGCGPGSLLEFLPVVDYMGFDLNSAYIEAAKDKYGARGTFFCDRVRQDTVRDQQFDLVIASGVVHHLSDPEAIDLFQLAHAVLRKGGRLVTLDGGYVPNQSRIARYMLSRDRGEHVRPSEDYARLARKVFSQVAMTIRGDLLGAVPYTHVILECTR